MGDETKQVVVKRTIGDAENLPAQVAMGSSVAAVREPKPGQGASGSSSQAGGSGQQTDQKKS